MCNGCMMGILGLCLVHLKQTHTHSNAQRSYKRQMGKTCVSPCNVVHHIWAVCLNTRWAVTIKLIIEGPLLEVSQLCPLHISLQNKERKQACFRTQSSVCGSLYIKNTALYVINGKQVIVSIVMFLRSRVFAESHITALICDQKLSHHNKF